MGRAGNGRGGPADAAARRRLRGPGGRVVLAAALGAVSVMVRRRPRAALELLAAGVAAAGLADRAGPAGRRAPWPPAPRARALRPAALKTGERRRLRSWLAAEAQRARKRDDVASR